MNIRAKIFGGPIAREREILRSKNRRQASPESLEGLIAREQSRMNHSRSEDRHRLVDERVRLSHGDQSHEVELINVSGGGAMVSGDVELALWDRVELRLGENGHVECVVCWLRDDRFGLEFAHETRIDCGDDELAAVLREVVRRTFPDVKFEADAQAARTASDERRELRHPLVWSGVVHHDLESSAGRLRNISATGAMVECSAALEVDAEVLLEIGKGLRVPATVAWVLGDQAGLRFTCPFDLHDLASSKPDVAAPRWKPPAYLQKATTADAPSGDPWGRMSVGELRQELEGYLKR